MDLLYKQECYQLVGACFEVYREKGCGFLEAVYQECLSLELQSQRIPAITQPELMLDYKGQPLKQTYRPDFVCFGKIIVELKAVSKTTDEHRAQLHNYLKASGYKLGILVNFGHYPQLQWERIIREKVERR